MAVLQFLDSGASQHVFIDPNRPESVWKVPAVFDDLLPSPQDLKTFAPTEVRKQQLWSLALPLARTRLLRGVADAGLRRYLRWQHVRRFRAMHRIIDAIPSNLRDSLMLPCRVGVVLGAMLRTPTGDRSYSGPALEQRRADRFMARALDLDFEWAAVVRIQHALWQRGVGICDAASVLGPHNWAVLDGRVLLGDTASLTRSFRAVRAVLQEPVLAEAREGVRRRLAAAGDEEVEKYFRVVQAGVNEGTLVGLWQAG